MANIIQNLLKVNKFGKSNLDEIINVFKNEFCVVGDEKISDTRYDFASRGINKDALLELSANREMKFTIINYDTSMGYAYKVVLDHGWISGLKNITFGMDLECELAELSMSLNKDFYQILSECIDKNSCEKANVVKVGNMIKINELVCSDIYLLDWYSQRTVKELEVIEVDFATNGIWVKDCEYRIDMSEVI